MSEKLAAALHNPRDCRWSCCKTPFGTCARNYTCDHHRAAEKAQQAQEINADLIEDMERRFRLAARKGSWA